MAGSRKNRYQKNREFLEYVDSVALAVVVIALVFTFCFRAVRVDGSSMNPTLLDGDRLVTTNFFYTPKRGDVVVVDSYIPHGLPLVKRVIGVAGDEIDIDFLTGTVTRNGEVLEETYVLEPTWTYEGVEFPITVPEGQLFLMGDNRNGSKDSRDPEIGCVDTRDILGKAIWRIAPLERMGVVE